MTFSSTKGTPYYRLQHRRANFDTVVALRVEGVSISAIARVEGIAWNTVARWLERAALSCRRFNSRRITGFAVEELQADEIRSFAGGKDRITWIFAAIEVWSRLWPSTVVGRRSYRNTLALVRDVADRMAFEGLPLIVTDGFDFYEKVVREGGPPRLWASGALCSSPEDAPKRSSRQGRTTCRSRSRVALRRGAQKLGRLVGIEHVFHRAPESDDPAKLGVPGATNAFLRSLEGEARRPPRARALPLQFRSAAQGVAVRAGDQDAGDAGWTRQAAPDAQGNLRVHVDIRININRVRRVRVRWRSQGGD